MSLDVPLERVWAEIADLGAHGEWMSDATAIHFVGYRTRGLGAQMRVPTKIGPFRSTDLMTVVGWEEGRMIAVEHRGAISGVGRFEVRSLDAGTELAWTESLRFPWWLGGPIGELVARPILRRMWLANLRRFGERVALSDP
jgi:hypothetical protein